MTGINFISITVFLLLILVLKNNFLPSEAMTWKDTELVKHNGTLKSIKVADGNIIDCVDIYKQPAFDHPLMKNHTIKDIGKSKIPLKGRKIHEGISQTWHSKGSCPEGTIPIRRTRRNEPIIKKPSPFDKRSVQPNPACTAKIAGVFTYDTPNIGARAILSVWNPTVEQLDFSLAEVAVYYNETGEPLETMEVGVHVNPTLYGDTNTHLFIYWTADTYGATGCYNLLCRGANFVQTDHTIALGGTFSATSQPNGPEYTIDVDIIQDVDSSNWYLYVSGRVIGYWPASLFINIENGANYAAWFGHVEDCNQASSTTTQMGSGYFPTEGTPMCAFFDEWEFVGTDGNYVEPDDYDVIRSHPQCYSVSILDEVTLLYGGPGHSDTC